MAKVPIIIEASPLVCSANQWTGFYIVGISVMKVKQSTIHHIFSINTIREVLSDNLSPPTYFISMQTVTTMMIYQQVNGAYMRKPVSP